MEIRSAKISDIDYVKSLADSLAVKPGENKTSGFYNYPLTKFQYLNRLKSPFFFISENGSGLEGFCMAYDSAYLKRLKDVELDLEQDSVSNYLSKLEVPFVYIDQLAIKAPGTFMGSLAAHNLRNYIMDEVKKAGISDIFAAVSHAPWKNVSAVRFVKKSDFNFQEEIDSNGVTLGIYKLKL